MPTPYERLLKEEEATRRRLRQTLEEARRMIRSRLLSFGPEENTAVVLTAMLRTVDRALARVESSFTTTLTTSTQTVAGLGEQSALADLPDWLRDTPFDLPDDLLIEVGRLQGARIAGITGDMRAEIVRHVQVGVLAGEPMEDIVQRIAATGLQATGLFRTAAARADAIAVTEIHGMFNRAAYARYSDAAGRIPGLEKEWVTAEDARVRPHHAALAGQRIPFDQFFNVGGVNARGPFDPVLPVGQVARCRCRLVCWPPEPEDE